MTLAGDCGECLLWQPYGDLWKLRRLLLTLKVPFFKLCEVRRSKHEAFSASGVLKTTSFSNSTCLLRSPFLFFPPHSPPLASLKGSESKGVVLITDLCTEEIFFTGRFTRVSWKHLFLCGGSLNRPSQGQGRFKPNTPSSLEVK
ncbi:unnamed protein product [Brassica napus]|uniref:(rape) hypothetical protein n=1 Tax=Brassica napus TaxID=3708 RepID=A0A816JJ62_BRANA|nr:unnamed protein product [Brassica napus]